MFRAVRKKKNEISIDAAKELLRCCRRGILAVNGDNGYPYAIPINYLYDEGAQKIIFHGAKAGHKVDALKACDKVCFTTFGNESIKEEEAWAPFLQSVVVFGRCHLIENREDTIKLVKQFALKYYPDEKMVDEEAALSGREVQMFEIEIEHLSGKKVQER
nr:pyridoxamine 5'-phosphate oxidase family protein [bacterium]